jgi:hypothetical protein
LGVRLSDAGELAHAGDVLTEAKSLEEALAEAFTRADSIDAPLDRKLQFYLGESRKLLPDLEATYDQLVALASRRTAPMFSSPP